MGQRKSAPLEHLGVEKWARPRNGPTEIRPVRAFGRYHEIGFISEVSKKGTVRAFGPKCNPVLG